MTGFNVFCRMPSEGPATNFYDGFHCPWSLAHSLDLLRAVKVDEGAVGAPSAPTQRLAHLTLDIEDPRVPRRLAPVRTDFGVLRAPKYPKRKERGGGGVEEQFDVKSIILSRILGAHTPCCQRLIHSGRCFADTKGTVKLCVSDYRTRVH